MRIKCGRMLGMVNEVQTRADVESNGSGGFSLSIHLDAPKMPDSIFVNTLIRGARRPSLFQFRRRRLIEHIAPRALKQIERVGFDRERAPLAWQLGDPLDACEPVLQTRRQSVRPRLVDI